MAMEVPYYRRWIAQVAHQLWAYLWLQFVAIIAGLAILLLEIVFRGEPETAFGPAVRATLWVYGSLAVLYFAYLVFHAPIVLDRERATRIDNLEGELKTLKAAQEDPKTYTEGQIARLQRLIVEGRTLYGAPISGSVQAMKIGLDNWIEKHDDWREKVLSILLDRDIAIFERPETAGHQTKARQGAINDTHGNKRGQLLAELERLNKIIGRDQQ
jgi:hypothetical protein